MLLYSKGNLLGILERIHKKTVLAWRLTQDLYLVRLGWMEKGR